MRAKKDLSLYNGNLICTREQIGCGVLQTYHTRALGTRERSPPQEAVTPVRTGMLNTPMRTTELHPVPGTVMALAIAVSEIIITVETQNVTTVGTKYGATLQIQQLGGKNASVGKILHFFGRCN